MSEKSKMHLLQLPKKSLCSMALFGLLMPVLGMSQTDANDVQFFLTTLETQAISEIHSSGKQVFDRMDRKRMVHTPARLICGSVILRNPEIEIDFVLREVRSESQPLWALKPRFSVDSIYRFLLN